MEGPRLPGSLLYPNAYSRAFPGSLSAFSIEDLEALLAILDKYDANVTELAECGEIPFTVGKAVVSYPSSRAQGRGRGY